MGIFNAIHAGITARRQQRVDRENKRHWIEQDRNDRYNRKVRTKYLRATGHDYQGGKLGFRLFAWSSGISKYRPGRNKHYRGRQTYQKRRYYKRRY